MTTPAPQNDARRTGFTGLSAISVFLAAVIVLTSTPAMLAGGLSEQSEQFARMGSQLRRLAAAMPVNLVAKAPKRHLHTPIVELASELNARGLHFGASIASAIRFDGPAVAPLLTQYMDLPPPVRAA